MQMVSSAFTKYSRKLQPLHVVMATLLVTGLAAIMAIPAFVSAQNTVLPGQSLQDQRTALEAAEQEADAAKQRADILQKRAGQAAASADKAKRQVDAVAAQVEATEARINALEVRIAIIAQLQKRQQSRLAERQQPVMRLAAALQQQSRRPAALALVKPGSVNDLVHMRAAMASITPQVDALSTDVRKDLRRTQTLREEADTAANALVAQRSQLDAQRSELALLETQRRTEARNLADDARREEDKAIALVEDARDITQLIGRIEDSAGLREELAALAGPKLQANNDGQAKAQNAGKRVYLMPVDGQVVTGFGEVSTSGISARGVTLQVQERAQISAPAKGRIAFAGVYRGFGQIVIIEHGDGWTSLLTGLRTIAVNVDDNVTQGAVIGRAVGGNEAVLLELRRKGKPVDVATLIAAG